MEKTVTTNGIAQATRAKKQKESTRRVKNAA